MGITPSVASATTKNIKLLPATEPPVITSVNQIPTYIEVYDCSNGLPTDSRTSAIDEIMIHDNQRCVVVATIFNTLHKPLALRVIHYELSNSNGTIIKTGKKLSYETLAHTPSFIHAAFFKLGKLPVGEYTLRVFYKGYKRGKLAPSEKYVKIQVIP